MKTKDFYTSPEVDVLVVQPEGVICQSGKVNPAMLHLSSGWGGDNAAGASLTEDLGYDL